MNTQQQNMFLAASTSSSAAWILCDWLVEFSDVPEEGEYLQHTLVMGESGWSLGKYRNGYGDGYGDGYGYGYRYGDKYGYGDGYGYGYRYGDKYGYGDGNGDSPRNNYGVGCGYNGCPNGYGDGDEV